MRSMNFSGFKGPESYIILDIFIKISQAVDRLHRRKIIYNDIQPDNIQIDPHDGSVSLAPSELSFDCAKGTPRISKKDPIKGQIAYISPERTGRTTHSIDFRSDLYSLGAVLYETLAGVPPFNFTDPAQIIHGHIAVEPQPVHQLNKTIPPLLSDITLKLLAKEPADRYQSVGGLVADLAHCLDQLRATGKISPFPIAGQDVSSVFEIPHKLYGRYAEIQRLIDGYQHASQGGVGMVLLSGPPGIGKTYLVEETQGDLVKNRGAIIHGKYNQYERINPCSAIIQAFNHLVCWILTMNDKQFNQTRQNILAAVGDNGQILIDAIPELELIIDKQPAVEPLGPEENQNRFNYVFRQFVRAIAKTIQPLIFFLDDLHWADNAGMKLLEAIFTDIELTHLLFIGCYRDIEAKENALFQNFLDIFRPKPHVSEIELEPVGSDYVAMLLEDIFAADDDNHGPFIDLIMAKTGGNPLFIKEFLINLYDKGLVRYVYEKGANLRGHWHIDIDGMLKSQLPDTVVELLTRRILKLPKAVQEALKVAACIGTEFSLDLIARTSDQARPKIHTDLAKAVDQGMLVHLETRYKFIHDRVQEAAYNLIKDHERKAIHYKAGKVLLSDVTTDDPGDKLFLITSQLNAALDQLSEDERHDLVVLNLKAGQRAKQLTAYTAAMDYLKIAIELSGDDCWAHRYDDALAIYTEAVETAYLAADFAYMEELAAAVIQNAKVFRDKVKSHEIRIRAYFSQNMLEKAVGEGVFALTQMGFQVSENPSVVILFWKFCTVNFLLRKTKLKSLQNIEDATDEDIIAVGRIIQHIYLSALMCNKRLFALLVLKWIEHTLKFGKTTESIDTFAFLGAFLCSKIGAVEKGYQIGLLPFSMAPHPPPKYIDYQSVIVGILILHWKNHIRHSLPFLLERYKLGMELGFVEQSLFLANIYCRYLWLSGEPLRNISHKAAYFNEIALQYKQSGALIHNEILHQFLLNLSGLSDDPLSMVGESAKAPATASDPFVKIELIFYRMLIAYFFENYAEAVAGADELSKYPDIAIGSFDGVCCYFYDSLCRLAFVSEDPNKTRSLSRPHNKPFTRKEQKHELRKVAANQKKLRKWAHYAPMNFMGKWSLVEAERLRFEGKKEQAIEYYFQAIELSEKHACLHEEAMSNELLAKSYLADSDKESAGRFFKKAYDLYERWEANAKCDHLINAYGDLFDRPQEVKNSLGESVPRQTLPVLNQADLDLRMLSDASELISNQNEMRDYLLHFSRIILKYSGGQRVLLLLNQANKLSVGIDHTIGHEAPKVLIPMPRGRAVFSHAIVRYVQRTHKKVLLDNAVEANLFALDPYVQKRQLKSVVCLPVNHQDNLLAILYIENNSNCGVFGPQHLDILKHLCSQFALSYENRNLKETISVNMESDNAMTPQALMDSLQKSYGLTQQEAKVAALFKDGLTRAQICDALQISLKTLRRHLQSIYDKTLNFEDDFSGEGRVDKLSRLILFLFKHCESQRFIS